METPVPAVRRPAGNTATTWLKIIALFFMFADHAGKMVFPNVPESLSPNPPRCGIIPVNRHRFSGCIPDPAQEEHTDGNE